MGGAETLVVDDTPPEVATNPQGLNDMGSEGDNTNTPSEEGSTIPTSSAAASTGDIARTPQNSTEENEAGVARKNHQESKRPGTARSTVPLPPKARLKNNQARPNGGSNAQIVGLEGTREGTSLKVCPRLCQDLWRADLQGHQLTQCDLKLRSVYGDYVHRNDGTHLTGGINDDALWQTRWRRISNLTPRFYDAPKGKAGRRFVILLTEEL